LRDKKGKNHELIKKRFEAVIKKAENGDIYSMRLIARAYTYGDYFPKDFFAAEGWLRKAIENGSKAALKQLAFLLSEGNGVAQDWEEAFNIYYELMLDYDLDGMTGLGAAYKYGKGVQQNDEKASFYIRRAFDIALEL